MHSNVRNMEPTLCTVEQNCSIKHGTHGTELMEEILCQGQQSVIQKCMEDIPLSYNIHKGPFTVVYY